MNTESIKIEQKASMGSHVTQIGSQIVYEGLSPVDACKLTTDLFAQNFPKLQEQAKKIVLSRVDELMDNVAKKFVENGTTNMSAFADPDVQYATYEAQKSYARFGTSEMLSMLSSLIAKRVEHNNDNLALKVAIDKAIEITSVLSTKHLDYLALLFCVSKVSFGSIKDIDGLKQILDLLVNTLSNADITTTSYLQTLGCLQLHLLDVSQVLANTYKLPKDQVKAICPEIVLQLQGDYSTSQIGTILAIVHLKDKLPFMFNPVNPEIWIHD